MPHVCLCVCPVCSIRVRAFFSLQLQLFSNVSITQAQLKLNGSISYFSKMLYFTSISTSKQNSHYVRVVFSVGCNIIQYDSTVGITKEHEITSPKNQPQFPPMTMRQYWLGKTQTSC